MTTMRPWLFWAVVGLLTSPVAVGLIMAATSQSPPKKGPRLNMDGSVEIHVYFHWADDSAKIRELEKEVAALRRVKP